jgi:phosphatidylglycerophosphate synthase
MLSSSLDYTVYHQKHGIIKNMNRMLETLRNAVRSVFARIARGLNNATGGKLSPNVITLFGLFMHLPIALLIASGDFVSAAIMLVIFGLFDTLDGALARVQNSTSKFGMLLDSVTDRMKEILIYIAIAYYFVSVHEPNFAIWAVAACGVSLLISYVNAWGEAVGKDTKPTHTTNKTFRTGIMSFDVRMFTIILGLAFDQLDIALVVIVALGSITAIERSVLTGRRLT